MSEDIHDAEKEMRKKSSVNNSQTERHTSVILPAWLIKLCRPSRMIWLAPLLGFILSVPSFFSGYSMDDHVFRQYGNEKSIYHQRPAWDFFNLTSSDKETALYREKGLFGWWTPDGFRFHEFRPLVPRNI